MEPRMKLCITQEHFTELIEHAQLGYPHEVVGILAGNQDTQQISVVHPLINEKGTTNNRYQVSALKLMRSEQALEKQGHTILGYYHSHPDHSAKYSEYDREHALPNMSYLIISVQKGVFSHMQSWRLKEDRSAMNLETLTIL